MAEQAHDNNVDQAIWAITDGWEPPPYFALYTPTERGGAGYICCVREKAGGHVSWRSVECVVPLPGQSVEWTQPGTKYWFKDNTTMDDDVSWLQPKGLPETADEQLSLFTHSAVDGYTFQEPP